MAIKGLKQVIDNLNSLDRTMVPKASAWAVNRVARTAVTAATRKVAKETVAGDNRVQGIPLKLVRQRVRVSKASPQGRVTAKIRVNRGNLPAIKLGAAQVRLTRKRGALLRKGSVLKIGKYLFRDAFVQQLANGRWHVMKRIAGKARYPIDVVKIPLVNPLTEAFEAEKKRMIEEEMPKQLSAALKQQLRLYLKR
ncbi:TPA: phage tail protein [Klebsiella pneumoniae]|uniref:phage tail protein n=1 Tax=Klebsiella pneumoniae TaxID=573 RepID=UPI0007CC7137|nr:phage tail protein [Klebsiella pneumoniae]MCF1380227.1 phage tail protein [Klebsiella pneumoniae]MCF2235223.1 phage tail protein [Klebsiella pneumoniae]MDV5335284.1 phage tail protein [Klebsiella pneumoniae]MDV5340655.1 phage tail protein [Klebsiella pneumoniae]MDV5361478.1 phage tail protein [Klebsiella pneumoniae]